LFGIGSVRARVFPAGAGWLISLGALTSLVLMMLPVNVGALMVNAAYVWMGAKMWPANAEKTAELRPAIAGD
jgi:hypothetical protein